MLSSALSQRLSCSWGGAGAEKLNLCFTFIPPNVPVPFSGVYLHRGTWGIGVRWLCFHMLGQTSLQQLKTCLCSLCIYKANSYLLGFFSAGTLTYKSIRYYYLYIGIDKVHQAVCRQIGCVTPWLDHHHVLQTELPAVLTASSEDAGWLWTQAGQHLGVET